VERERLNYEISDCEKVMKIIDNRGKCRNCRIGLTCSNCGRNHNDKRPDYYPLVDINTTFAKPGIIGHATRDICQCEDKIRFQL